MEIRPRKGAEVRPTRGSGPGARRRRSDALGPRKDVIIRMPEDLAYQLKILAAHENMTVQDFSLTVLRPSILQGLHKHGLNPELIKLS
jgi:hypothetical protein